MEKIKENLEKSFEEENEESNEEKIRSILMESPFYKTSSEEEIEETIKRILEYFAEMKRKEKE